MIYIYIYNKLKLFKFHYSSYNLLLRWHKVIVILNSFICTKLLTRYNLGKMRAGIADS